MHEEHLLYSIRATGVADAVAAVAKPIWLWLQHNGWQGKHRMFVLQDQKKHAKRLLCFTQFKYQGLHVGIGRPRPVAPGGCTLVHPLGGFTAYCPRGSFCCWTSIGSPVMDCVGLKQELPNSWQTINHPLLQLLIAASGRFCEPLLFLCRG